MKEDTEKDKNNVKSLNIDPRILIYVIALVLFFLQLILYLRGIDTQWYKNLDTTSASLDPGLILWVGTYISASIGYGWILYKYKDVNIEFIISLTVIGIALSVIWDFVFFYAQDILLSVLVQIAACALYAWLLYVVFSISGVAGFFHLPITIYTYYQFYLNVKLFLSNSERSNLRPIYNRDPFN